MSQAPASARRAAPFPSRPLQPERRREALKRQHAQNSSLSMKKLTQKPSSRVAGA